MVLSNSGTIGQKAHNFYVLNDHDLWKWKQINDRVFDKEILQANLTSIGAKPMCIYKYTNDIYFALRKQTFPFSLNAYQEVIK